MCSEFEALQRTPLVLDDVCSSYSRRPAYYRDISEADWQSYTWQMSHRLTNAAELSQIIDLSDDEIQAIQQISGQFPMLISPHYAALIRPELGPKCPIRRQAVPLLDELDHHASLLDDPLGERRHAMCHCLTRRYPDRALIYATHECAMRCRHCTRRSRVGLMETVSASHLENALDAVKTHSNIRDVLISGGDPLSLPNEVLRHLIAELRQCPHIDVIRLCTRMICTLPQRCSDPGLLEILREFAPIYVNTQFNHPFEATVEAADAFRHLREAGCILGNQSVLLRGINDSAEILEPLYRWLLRCGCRPYYLFLCDVAQGTAHFRTPIQVGLRIMKTFRGRLSGLAIPHFVVDLPDGMGKVDLCPDSIVNGQTGEMLTFRNWFGVDVPYDDCVC